MQQLSYTLNGPFSVEYWPFKSLILCPSAASPPRTLLVSLPSSPLSRQSSDSRIQHRQTFPGKKQVQTLTCSFPGCPFSKSFRVSASLLPGSFHWSLMHLNRSVFCASHFFLYSCFFLVGTLIYSKVPHHILKWMLIYFFTLIFITEPCFKGSKLSLCC